MLLRYSYTLALPLHGSRVYATRSTRISRTGLKHLCRKHSYTYVFVFFPCEQGLLAHFIVNVCRRHCILPRCRTTSVWLPNLSGPTEEMVRFLGVRETSVSTSKNTGTCAGSSHPAPTLLFTHNAVAVHQQPGLSSSAFRKLMMRAAQSVYCSACRQSTYVI